MIVYVCLFIMMCCIYSQPEEAESAGDEMPMQKKGHSIVHPVVYETGEGMDVMCLA
jgi:hypothetical protein